MHIKNKQTGSALIVSLMMLLVMTVIGVSSISSTNLEERMAQNFQLTTTAFQAAESAINKVIESGNPDSYVYYDSTNDPLVAAMNSGVGSTSTVVTHNMDPDNHLINSTLNTSSTVVFIRSLPICPETSIGGVAVCNHFEIRTNATISASSTNVNHVQGIFRTGGV